MPVRPVSNTSESGGSKWCKGPRLRSLAWSTSSRKGGLRSKVQGLRVGVLGYNIGTFTARIGSCGVSSYNTTKTASSNP